MKKFIFLFPIFFVISAFQLSVIPNDIKEYGLHGKVKEITTMYYTELEKNSNDEWELDLDKLVALAKMFFDSSGNITKIEEHHKEINSSWQETITKFEFKDGQKKSYLKKDINGQLIESGEYKWIDNNHYTLISTRVNGLIIESHSTLNENLRDLKGDFKYMLGDSILYSENYTNQVNKDGEIMNTLTANQITNESYITDFKNKVRDQKGNMIKVALVYRHNGELQKLSVREIEYYN